VASGKRTGIWGAVMGVMCVCVWVGSHTDADEFGDADDMISTSEEESAGEEDAGSEEGGVKGGLLDADGSALAHKPKVPTRPTIGAFGAVDPLLQREWEKHCIRRAHACLQRHRWTAAIEICRDGLEIDPNSRPLDRYLTQAYHPVVATNTRDWELSRADWAFPIANQIAARSMPRYERWGEEEMAAGKFGSAAVVYRAALDEDPRDASSFQAGLQVSQNG
jgi:hypothetical protein